MNTILESWDDDEDYLKNWATRNHVQLTEDHLDSFCELVCDYRNVMSEQMARDTAIYTIFHL